MSGTLQLRGDLAVTWTAVNPILAARELGFEKDTLMYKVGDGTTDWNTLGYAPFSTTAASLLIAGLNSDPTEPASGNLVLYSKAVSGRMLAKIAGPSGLTTALQPFLARNKVGYWCPPGNSSYAPAVLGYTPLIFTGSTTTRNVTIYNTFNRMRRLAVFSSATAGSVCGSRTAVGQVTVGDGSGNGGFHKVLRWGISDPLPVAGARCFIGMSAITSAPINLEPSALTFVIGMGNGAADTTMHMYCSGYHGPIQTVDLGAAFPCNTISADPYELSLFSSSNETATIHWEVTNIGSGAVATGTFTGTQNNGMFQTTDLISYHWGYRSNNATARSVAYDIMSDYIETDN